MEPSFYRDEFSVSPFTVITAYRDRFVDCRNFVIVFRGTFDSCCILPLVAGVGWQGNGIIDPVLCPVVLAAKNPYRDTGRGNRIGTAVCGTVVTTTILSDVVMGVTVIGTGVGTTG